ncbi:MAG TPA: undecaprenyl-diphosphate phosphatase [Paludibacteraceae bacterium]|nr:undecaprenyl-diphosphate phosphatase [Paludibacteraceae bacterium]
MSFFQAILIAIVEGLTEFLPVSSTGHMIIIQSLLGIESTDFVKVFTVNIQFGAILSVIVLYWKRFFKLNPLPALDKTFIESKKDFAKWKVYFQRFLYKYDFYWKLLIGFLPTGIIGFLASDYIDTLLGEVWVVALMLLLGGILMIFIDQWLKYPSSNQEISWKRALEIGFCQCIAMIPGVSRSMATIVGGMATKLNRKNAAEFSFFLAVPTMAAASIFKLIELLHTSNGSQVLTQNLSLLLVGNIVAFVVAMAAIKFFIDFLTKHGFKAFGYYRIIVGAFLLILIYLGIDLKIV